jgi:hypothetical protein
LANLIENPAWEQLFGCPVEGLGPGTLLGSLVKDFGLKPVWKLFLGNHFVNSVLEPCLENLLVNPVWKLYLGTLLVQLSITCCRGCGDDSGLCRSPCVDHHVDDAKELHLEILEDLEDGGGTVYMFPLSVTSIPSTHRLRHACKKTKVIY